MPDSRRTQHGFAAGWLMLLRLLTVCCFGLCLLAKNRNRRLIHLLRFFGRGRRGSLARCLRGQHVLVYWLSGRQGNCVAHRLTCMAPPAPYCPIIVMEQPAQQSVENQCCDQGLHAVRAIPAPDPSPAPASVPAPGARCLRESYSSWLSHLNITTNNGYPGSLVRRGEGPGKRQSSKKRH